MSPEPFVLNMIKPKMAHVYLSYSRQDNDFVDLIENDLSERGHVVWRDTSSVSEEDDWGEAIGKALQSAYALAVAVTEISLSSDWIQQEISSAQSSDTPVVLLLLEDCEVPSELKEASLVDFSQVRNASGLDQLNLYRSAMQSLVGTLDKLYPVRVYIQDLTNTNDVARETAARKLGNLGDPSATEALIRLLVDPDVDVRFVTAESLGKLHSQSALRPLIRVLGDDDDPDVRAARGWERIARRVSAPGDWLSVISAQFSGPSSS